MIKFAISIYVINPISNRPIIKSIYTKHDHDSGQSYDDFRARCIDKLEAFRDANRQIHLDGTITSIERL